jgi:hypothetical protein
MQVQGSATLNVMPTVIDIRLLIPTQVDAIASTAEPYAASAQKRARRLSLAAGELMEWRVSFGASPAKPHCR